MTNKINDYIDSGYLVTVKRQKIWRIELGLLKEVDKICKKNDIKYFATGGTLLGAIRHKGFIPWDDDIDVAMLRNDYQKFIKIAEKEIKEPYFFQTTLTDINYYKDHARLRDSRTTGICEHLMLNGCNNGIYLDIVPLDKGGFDIVDKIVTLFVKTLSAILSVKVHYNKNNNNSFFYTLVYYVSIFFNLKITHKLREKILCLYSKNKSKYVNAKIRIKSYDIKKLTWESEWLESLILMPFENTYIPVPVGFDNILKTQYGRYMEVPSDNDKDDYHHVIFDPDTPYDKYIAENYINK